MTTVSNSRATRNQLWLNPVIGGLCIVAANFLFGAAVHRSFSNWFVLSMTCVACVLLVLGALSVKVSDKSSQRRVLRGSRSRVGYGRRVRCSVAGLSTGKALAPVARATQENR